MKWFHQLRWKLFFSHTIIIVIAVAVLLGTAQFLMNAALSSSDDLATATVSQAERQALSEEFRMILEEALLVASFGALAAAIVASLFVSRRIVEPLQELTQVSRRLSLGYYRERTFIGSQDELAMLSQSVNQLAEALDQTEQRRLGLIADVAHELRTPLTTIEGYMEGLLDGVIAPDEQTFTLVRHEAARLQRLTEELSLLSRAEAGELDMRPQAFDLADLLSTLITRFQPQFVACELDLQLRQASLAPFEPSPDPSMRISWWSEPMKVYADPDRISQVIINLLANALRYTPAGGRVTVSLTANEDNAHLAVHDTGIGIAADHLPHIFERFYRVDKSRARASGGTGVGLTIARHIVYAHGGEIWAESLGVGQGATFHVTLPLYKPAFQIQIEPDQPTD